MMTTAPRERPHRSGGVRMSTVADRPELTTGPETDHQIELVERFSAHNYHPLPVVVSEAEGVWVTDVDGNRYLDMLSAYSALNFGHRHPRLVEAARRQLDRLTLTSRAFHNDRFGQWAEEMAELAGMEMVLPMNTGAEGVETAIKTARKWGYQVKGVARDGAKSITCADNFHGRTTTIVGFSTDPTAREGFGPFTPGFVSVPYGDAEALADAFDEDVVAFLVEPIQGEAGVIVPPAGYLQRARELCESHGALLIADEIQSGLGRTGYTFAVEHDGVRPDIFILGKALGGGIMPLSAVVSSREILGVFKPGEHGSTFGGNPLACAIGLEVLAMLREGEVQDRSKVAGERMLGAIRDANLPAVKEVRGRGLWAGIQLVPDAMPARARCEELMRLGVLAKDTHESTIRLAPPLVIGDEELDWAIERILAVLERAAR
jgi:ornithine--oxo-acid transaminase